MSNVSLPLPSDQKTVARMSVGMMAIAKEKRIKWGTISDLSLLVRMWTSHADAMQININAAKRNPS
jgi:hypothetical protein